MYNDKELLNIASEYVAEGEKALQKDKSEESIGLFAKAISIFKRLKSNEDVAEVSNKMGVAYSMIGNDDMATECFLNALEGAVSNQNYILMARIYNNIGSSYQCLHQNSKAKDFYHRAEKAILNQECRKHDMYSLMSLVINVNLCSTYCHLGEYEKSHFYLEKTKKYYMKNSQFDFMLLVVECMLSLEMGKREFVIEHVDDLIKGIADNINGPDYLQNVNDVCDLFSKLDDYERWEKCLKIFSAHAKRLNTVYMMMQANELWSRYYRGIGDLAGYQRACADHMELYLKHRHSIEKSRSNNIDLKITLQTSKLEDIESQKKTHVDILTKVGDRYKLGKDYENFLEVAQREKKCIGIGIVDVDDFMKFNDKYGHIQGDKCLKQVAVELQNILEGVGLVYRIGGDEFVVLLSECNEEGVEELAQLITETVSSLEFLEPGTQEIGYISVSQGYAFINPSSNIQLEMFLGYAQQALDTARKDKNIQYQIIQADKKDYKIFFDKYIQNLDEESMLEGGFRQAENQDQWLMNLQQRAMHIRELYKENERIVSRYITPIVLGQQKLTQKVALLSIQRIWKLFQDGQTDYCLMLEYMEILQQYFEKENMSEENIRALIILINNYYGLDANDYFYKTQDLFEKIQKYESYFNDTDNMETKQILCNAYMMKSIHISENEKTTMDQCLEEIDKDVQIFFSVDAAQAFDFTYQDAEEYLDYFILRIITGNLLHYYSPEPGKESFRKAYALICDIYKRYCKKVYEVYQIDDRLFACYHKLKWLLGMSTLEECFSELLKMYEYNINEAETEEELKKPMFDRKRFHLIVYYVPEIMRLESLIAEPYFEKNAEQFIGILQDYIGYVKDIPKTGNENYLNRILYRSLARLMSHIPEWINSFDFLFQIIIERDVDITLHSYMVGEISKLVVEMIFRNNPSLFIGTLGFEKIEDVENGWPEIMDFIYNASLIHDVGKVAINHITKKQTRKLVKIEFDHIRKHPQYGELMALRSPLMKKYIPMIMGHHRFYNDKDGYPSNYRYLDKPEPLLVSIIQFSDCMDAATDYLGRVYAKAKTYDVILKELESKKGVQYNDVLIELMLEDEQFQKDLSNLVTTGREELCYEIYNQYLSE